MGSMWFLAITSFLVAVVPALVLTKFRLRDRLQFVVQPWVDFHAAGACSWRGSASRFPNAVGVFTVRVSGARWRALWQAGT